MNAVTRRTQAHAGLRPVLYARRARRSDSTQPGGLTVCELTLTEAGYTRAEIRAIQQAREEREMQRLQVVMSDDAAPFADKLAALNRAGELVAAAADRALEAWGSV